MQSHSRWLALSSVSKSCLRFLRTQARGVLWNRSARPHDWEANRGSYCESGSSPMVRIGVCKEISVSMWGIPTVDYRVAENPERTVF